MVIIKSIEEVEFVIRIFQKLFQNADKENIELIRNSKYFDSKYYLAENPDIKGDPCSHYYYYGWREGKSPSFSFSNDFYLKNYKDVEDAGINPLLHYLKFGKSENRLIEKDNGLSLKKIYEQVYHCAYFYKTYICDVENKRLNLFFDYIDSSLNSFAELLNYVIEFCNTYDYQLRIVYLMADFEILKEVLEKHHLVLPKNIIFLNLKSSNYLEIGLKEKYIATSWRTARALLNTASIHDHIYYYLSDGFQELPKEEFYQISNICTNGHVTILTKKKENLKYLKKCQLKFEVNRQLIHFKKINQLYCDFDQFFIVGVELLNDAFLSGALDPSIWKVNILEYGIHFNKFHFDTGVTARSVSSKMGDADFLFQLSYHKKDISNDIPYVNAWVEETEFVCKNYILLNQKNAYQELLENRDFSISGIDHCNADFKKYLNMLYDKE